MGKGRVLDILWKPLLSISMTKTCLKGKHKIVTFAIMTKFNKKRLLVKVFCLRTWDVWNKGLYVKIKLLP